MPLRLWCCKRRNQKASPEALKWSRFVKHTLRKRSWWLEGTVLNYLKNIRHEEQARASFLHTPDRQAPRLPDTVVWDPTEATEDGTNRTRIRSRNTSTTRRR